MTPPDPEDVADTPSSLVGENSQRLRIVGSAEPETAPRISKRPPHNLPLELDSFVGREREIAELKELLSESRLLTLTGPGGCGKTRLALAVASEVVEDFEDGVWWVGLASLSDPELVPQAVASALEVREAAGRSFVEALAEHLRSRRTLLVVDNCEHLISACAALADTLLRACSDLRILATSREALSVSGERAWLVPPLSLPDAEHPLPSEELARYEAVRLFVERAKSVASRFELTERNASAVARVCWRLDGMPLAIELAAARVRVVSVEQISSRLEESFRLLATQSRTALPRQQTLRATIEWSHDLLSDEEQVLFRRLAVFAGGFTLEAAEEVCAGGGIEREEVLDLLTRLVDKSLILVAEQDGEARYRLLETVRHYGWEKLKESGEAELVRRWHAEYYLTLSEETEPELKEQGAWLRRLGAEHGNLRAALGWALEPQDVQQPSAECVGLGLRLAVALGQGRFWAAYGLSEGLGWLERGLVGSSSRTSLRSVRAKALREAGWLANVLGDYEKGIALLEEGLALSKELEDKPGVTASLVQLGQLLAMHQGDRERVEALVEEAEALRRELSDPQAIADLLLFLGLAAWGGDDHERAVALLEEDLALFRELGDLRGVVMCLGTMGMAALEKGDLEQAAGLFEELLRVLRKLKDKIGIFHGLHGLAAVAGSRGRPARAARLWGAAEALGEATAVSMLPLMRSHYDYEGCLATARSQLDEAAWEAAWAEGRAMSPEEAIEYALLSEPLPQTAPPKDDEAGLSERELEVLRLVAEGLTDSQVADRLYLSRHTVGHHLRSIYRKLGVPSRAAAAKAALERDLI